MDPNATLARIREIIAETQNGNWEHVNELPELNAAMDDWLSHDGFLPDAWYDSGDLRRVHVTFDVTAPTNAVARARVDERLAQTRMDYHIAKVTTER